MRYYENYGMDTRSIKKILAKYQNSIDPYRLRTLMMLLCDRVEMLEQKNLEQLQVIRKDEKQCIGLSVCGGPCDNSCPVVREENGD